MHCTTIGGEETEDETSQTSNAGDSPPPDKDRNSGKFNPWWGLKPMPDMMSRVLFWEVASNCHHIGWIKFLLEDDVPSFQPGQSPSRETLTLIRNMLLDLRDSCQRFADYVEPLTDTISKVNPQWRPRYTLVPSRYRDQ